MNMYTKLSMHLSRHQYKRGQYKGDAPADPSRRGRNHFRVTRTDGSRMGVIFHRTQIITAHEDGRVAVSLSGYESSQTTRAACWLAGVNIFSEWRNGFRNTMAQIKTSGKAYVYYDHMVFNEDGTLETEPMPMEAYRADKVDRAEFRKDAAEFRALLPVLFATRRSRETYNNTAWDASYARQGVKHMTMDIITNTRVDDYPQLIDAWAKDLEYTNYHGHTVETTPKAVWDSIYRHCTRDMRSVVAVAQA
jgi:hypothetical protein